MFSSFVLNYFTFLWLFSSLPLHTSVEVIFLSLKIRCLCSSQLSNDHLFTPYILYCYTSSSTSMASIIINLLRLSNVFFQPDFQSELQTNMFIFILIIISFLGCLIHMSKIKLIISFPSFRFSCLTKGTQDNIPGLQDSSMTLPSSFFSRTCHQVLLMLGRCNSKRKLPVMPNNSMQP